MHLGLHAGCGFQRVLAGAGRKRGRDHCEFLDHKRDQTPAPPWPPWLELVSKPEAGLVSEVGRAVAADDEAERRGLEEEHEVAA